MTAHSMICRLGAADTKKISPNRQNTVVTQIQLVNSYRRLDFGLGQFLEQLTQLGFQPSEIAIDLAILGAVMTAADTRINRNSEAEDNWTRQIDLYVPVSDPMRWDNTKNTVERMMNFLTGDRWTITFRARPNDFRQMATIPPKLAIDQPDCVCLFSGGLDSFVGAIDLFSEKMRPLLVSHYWDGITSSHQSFCAQKLGKEFGAPIFHARARVGFPINLVAPNQTENSLRGRSFMFFALAALAASALKKNTTIFVPENGLISLNVPLDPLRVGSLSTRTTHPYYMARWNDLLKELDIKAKLDNPYRHQTKGEMIKGCKNQIFLKKHAAATMSCSSPAKIRWKGKEPMHCGHCVPCLIRRAALVAGFGSDDTKYFIEKLNGRPLNSTKAEGEHVRAFQRSIARLKAKPNSARFIIHQPGPLIDHLSDWPQYEDVYIKGMKEVENILGGVVTKPL